MGNTPPTPTSLRLSNGDHSYQVQIGRSATVYFNGKEVTTSQGDGPSIFAESWEVSYIVDNKSTCKITLAKVKISGSIHHDWGLFIYIKDDTYGESSECIFHAANSVHEGLLSFAGPNRVFETPFISMTTNALGEVTTTRFYFYGSGKRLSLLVYEMKRKTSGVDPYTGTVVYYYTNTENGQDIGLSIALKRIRVLGYVGRLDYAVDGPEQHPVAALLYMFDEVRRTNTWRPNSCPHCANNIIKSQRAGIWQSESEDSDTDNVVPALVSGRRKNARGGGGGGGGLLINGGMIKGSNNGNLKINKFIVALGGK